MYLGDERFSRTLLCRNIDRSENFAIKFEPNELKAKNEIKILNDLKDEGVGQHNIVFFHEYFTHEVDGTSYTCIACESLGKSLRQFIE